MFAPTSPTRRPRLVLLCVALLYGCSGSPPSSSEPAPAEPSATAAVAPLLVAQDAWRPANLGTEGADVRALAIDHLDPRTLYAATLGGGLYKTTSAGRYWRLVGAGLPRQWPTDVAVDPQQSETVYVATSSGVYKSTDGGANFLPPGESGRMPTFAPLVVAPSNPNVLYVVGQSGYLLRSADAGSSWSLSEQPIGTFVVHPENADVLYAIRDSGEVYATADGGVTFTRLGSDLPSSMSYGESTIAIDPSFPDTLYVAISGHGMFRSEDAGATFVAIGSDVAAGRYYQSIHVDPFDSSHLLLGASVYPRPGGLFESYDGGASFVATAYQLMPTSLLFDPRQEGRIYWASGIDGVYRSDDALASYERVMTGFNNVAVSELAADAFPGTLYFASRNAIHRTATAGLLWKPALAVPDGLVAGLLSDATRAGRAYASFQLSNRYVPSPDDPDILLGYFRPAVLYATTDGGRRWRTIGAGLGRYQVVRPVAVAPDAGVLYVYAGGALANDDRAALSAHHLFRTSDGGDTWEHTADFAGTVDAVLALSADHIFVSVLPRGLFESEDGGRTVRQVALDLTRISALGVDPRDSSVLYAGATGGATPPGQGSGLRKSTDGGRTWFAPNAELADVSIRALAVGRKDGRLYLTTGTSVLVSEDQGATFMAAGEGLEENEVTALAADPYGACSAYAGTRGEGVFVTRTAGGTCGH